MITNLGEVDNHTVEFVLYKETQGVRSPAAKEEASRYNRAQLAEGVGKICTGTGLPVHEHYIAYITLADPTYHAVGEGCLRLNSMEIYDNGAVNVFAYREGEIAACGFYRIRKKPKPRPVTAKVKALKEQGG